jgi:hypothetical protein
MASFTSIPADRPARRDLAPEAADLLPYDALCRWRRDAADEVPSWPSHTPKAARP